MSHETLVTKYDYDLGNDYIFFYGSNKKDMSSIVLGGIILDISEDNQVMAIEILDASNRFGLAKEDLRNINYFETLIEVSEEDIMLITKMGVSKRNEIIDTGLNALGLNSINLPISTQEMALNC